MTTPIIVGSTSDAPAPAGPYSQSVRIGSLIMCSGQAGFLPDGTLVEGVEGQTRQTFRNLLAALAAAGGSSERIGHVRVYLTDTEHFAVLNDVYREFFTEPYPARTTVYVGLPAGLLVEADLIAEHS